MVNYIFIQRIVVLVGDASGDADDDDGDHWNSHQKDRELSDCWAQEHTYFHNRLNQTRYIEILTQIPIQKA